MDPSSFSVAEGRLAGFFVESIILGLYLVTFVHTFQALFSTGTKWRSLADVNRPMAFVALFMFINVILGSATSFYIVWRAFILLPPAKGAASFAEISNWAVVLKSADLLTQTTIGDAMLIYRCWVIYGRNWLVIIPSLLLWLGGTVCSVFLVYYEVTFTSDALISASKLHPFGVAFWASTVTLNVITTALIVWPIWKAARRHDKFAYHSANSGNDNIMKDIMYVIIESGLMYTVAAFITFVTYTTKHNSLYIASSAEVGIAGIAFNLIIIRTAKATRVKPAPSVGLNLPLHLVSSRTSAVPTEQTQVRAVISGDSVNGSMNDSPGPDKPEESANAQPANDTYLDKDA
ncbi:hypothetical protein FPV67DRAFT_1672874 [Lyophyllum atratum]|nr:hypothetical protein FPV67DRAFT_1672874 [Lyophyllum atratum]